MLKLGNLSVLGDKIGGKVKFDGFNSTGNSQCLAYGRDRGETDYKATSFEKLPTDLQDWNYLFKDGEWFVSSGDDNEYVPLTLKIIKEDNIPESKK